MRERKGEREREREWERERVVEREKETLLHKGSTRKCSVSLHKSEKHIEIMRSCI